MEHLIWVVLGILLTVVVAVVVLVNLCRCLAKIIEGNNRDFRDLAEKWSAHSMRIGDTEHDKLKMLVDYDRKGLFEPKTLPPPPPRPTLEDVNGRTVNFDDVGSSPIG